jgi:succinate-semialdehyde dehydrogenase/glutarate-semialdehyde dehydrogenase
MLQNPALLAEVNRSRPTFEVRNPADPDSVVGEVSVMDRSAATSCIEKSHQVLPSWRDGTTATERSRLLTEWARLIQENKEDIATIMTMESGKPLQESRGEVTYGASFLDFYAAEAVRPTGAGGGFMVPTPFAHAETGAPRGQIMAIQQAVGVTVSITPWNFPLSMVRIVRDNI